MGGNRVQDEGSQRRCAKCLEWKERETEFYKHHLSKLGFTTWCSSCIRLYKKQYRLKKNFNGFTIEQYNKLLEKQDFCCGICKESRPLHVDHSHVTGKIRGLLCGSCNRAIGLLQESTKILVEAVEYLNHNPMELIDYSPLDNKELCKKLHEDIFEDSPTYGFVYCRVCDWFPYGHKTKFEAEKSGRQWGK